MLRSAGNPALTVAGQRWNHTKLPLKIEILSCRLDTTTFGYGWQASNAGREQMEYRKLGNSGMYVSEISYGNWITHGSQVEQDAAIKCVRTALDCGITTLDTADVYAGTKAEAVLGKALKGVRRESYELFTKVYWPTGPGKNDRGLSRKHIMESVHASLKRLNTDHIDLYQFHRFDYETPLEESLSAFDDLIRQGKVMYIGFSEWRAEEISAAVKIQKELGYNRFVSSQPQYSAIWRVIEKEVDPICKREGIGHIVWSPIAQGVLTGKYLPGHKAPAGSRATDKKGGANMISRWLRDDVLTAVQKLKPIADHEGLTMGQLAIAWVLQNPNVSSAIIGATKPAQVKENVKASGVKLSAETLRAIDQALSGVIERDPIRTESPKPRA
jgi:aryl-alcohol dehydrogenase-like predicted oxidoreductase